MWGVEDVARLGQSLYGALAMGIGGGRLVGAIRRGESDKVEVGLDGVVERVGDVDLEAVGVSGDEIVDVDVVGGCGDGRGCGGEWIGRCGCCGRD